MNIIAEFTLLFILCEAVLVCAKILLSKKESKASVRAVLTGAKFLGGIALAVIPLAGPVQLRKLQPVMMAAYAALFADACADIILAVIRKAAKKEKKTAVSVIAGLLAGIAFFVFGVVNMETVRPVYHTYTSQKLTAEHRAVFAADMHVGSAQPFSVTEKTIEAMKNENPDFIILGGDITDDYTTAEEMRETFRLFAETGIPVYYIYGNHDRQGHAEYANGRQYTPEELADTLDEYGITALSDEFAVISEDLVLLGREDISEGNARKSMDELENPAKDAYLLVADHQPAEFKKNAGAGADLQLSGHTHAGQLFPLKLFYKLIGYVYGDYEYEGAVMNVSSGACGWRMPIRTDSGCHFEVVTMMPAG